MPHITPMQAIKKHCRQCMGGFEDCTSPLCPLYPFRPAENNSLSTYHTIRQDGFGKTQKVFLSPLRAIRKQCKECFGFEETYRQITECENKKCPLWSLRFGIGYKTAKNRGLDV